VGSDCVLSTIRRKIDQYQIEQIFFLKTHWKTNERIYSNATKPVESNWIVRTFGTGRISEATELVDTAVDDWRRLYLRLNPNWLELGAFKRAQSDQRNKSTR
jgi:hypothetical protein